MKFFNKIRKRAMTKNKVVRYLIYAFGEILLVVIGILIAVSVNNAKKEYDDKAELHRILKKVSSDLQLDIKTMDSTLAFINQFEKVTDRILYPENNINSNDCEECKYILTGYYNTEINLTGRQQLQSYNKSTGDLQKLIDKIEMFYLKNIPTVKLNDEFVIEQVKDFFNNLRDNKPWFTDFFVKGKCNTECENYFSSYQYVNQVAIINTVVVESQFNELESYTKEASALIKSINAVVQD